MTSEIQIRVFSLSIKDIFKDGLEYAIYWLMKKGDNPCYFRENSPRNLPSGSIMLFKFKAQIFGQAIVKEEKRKVSAKKQAELRAENGYLYKHYLTFEPSSIDIFQRYPSQKEVEQKLNIKLARNFAPLSWEQYQEVLKMAKRRPE